MKKPHSYAAKSKIQRLGSRKSRIVGVVLYPDKPCDLTLQIQSADAELPLV